MVMMCLLFEVSFLSCSSEVRSISWARSDHSFSTCRWTFSLSFLNLVHCVVVCCLAVSPLSLLLLLLLLKLCLLFLSILWSSNGLYFRNSMKVALENQGQSLNHCNRFISKIHTSKIRVSFQVC